MNKSMFKRFAINMKKRWSHISKSARFDKVLSEPTGSKFKKWCSHESRRGADGTMRH